MNIHVGRAVAVGVTALVVAGAAAGVWSVSSSVQQSRVQAVAHQHALVVAQAEHVSRVGDQTAGEADAQAEQQAAHDAAVKAAQQAAVKAAAVKAAAVKAAAVKTSRDAVQQPVVTQQAQQATVQQPTQPAPAQQPPATAPPTPIMYHGPQSWTGAKQPAGSRVPMIIDDDPNSGQYGTDVPKYDQSYCATGALSTVGGVIECAN